MSRLSEDRTSQLLFGRTVLPAIWESTIFQIVTWCVVAVLSVYSASVAALFLHLVLPPLAAKFCFGALIAVRWFISGFIAIAMVKRLGKAVDDELHRVGNEDALRSFEAMWGPEP